MLESILQTLLGIPLLLWGRKLFWLIIGALGFLAGLVVVQQYFPALDNNLQIIAALAAGVIGSLLAVMMQKAAVWVIGFLAGGYLMVLLLHTFAPGREAYVLLAFLIGGVVGAILMIALFEWTLVVLSSIAGALLIARSLPFPTPVAAVLFIVLLIIGLVFQFRQKKKE